MQIQKVENEFQEESVSNARSVFNKIKPYITKPKFFQTRSSYLVIQVDQQPKTLSVDTLKKEYGGVIAGMVERAEKNITLITLNEAQL